MSTLKVSVLAKDRLVWEGLATMVGARTFQGEVAILAGHIPYIATLAPDVITITEVSGNRLGLDGSEGFLCVENDTVTILLNTAGSLLEGVESKY